jgi:hypothetical protein
MVDIRSLRSQVDPTARASDPLYQAAVSAIERRDYALALDALQAARARSPDDPRVWNAMGVVYDKLGRFDLSARYYAQARELDPTSPEVNQNLAYSAVLQQKQTAPEALAAAPRPDPKPTIYAAAPERTVALTERAQLDTAAPRARWTGPAPAEAQRPAHVVAPIPVLVSRPQVPAAALAVSHTALSPVVQPAGPVQTARSQPPVSGVRLAAVAEPLARFAAPVLDAFEASAPKAAAQAPIRTAPVRAPVIAAAPAPAPITAPVAAKPTLVAATVAAPVRQASVVAAPGATRVQVARPIQVAKPTTRIVLARNTPQSHFLLGRPLQVVNASGRRGGAELLRLSLASRGWTAPVSIVRPGAPRTTSTIVYASRNVGVARALARTLPYRVQLVSCGATCRGVTLFVGADALRVKSGPTRTRMASNRARA